MKKIIYLLAWIGLALASCSDESSLPIQPEIPAEPETPKDEPAPEKDYHQLPVLHVEGRYLKNEKGETVNLHGFTQTYSPFFNDNAWTNYDVQSCLSYNKRMVDGIVAAGWKFNFVRMHLDPYWSDDTSKPFVRYEGHERFSETRFRKYLDELFVPMAEYFVSKGMYVVMRPPGVCPNEAPYQGIEVGDSYQQFLLNVWDIVSQHPKVKNNTDIMFELANEPVNIKGTFGCQAWPTSRSMPGMPPTASRAITSALPCTAIPDGMAAMPKKTVAKESALLPVAATSPSSADGISK